MVWLEDRKKSDQGGIERNSTSTSDVAEKGKKSDQGGIESLVVVLVIKIGFSLEEIRPRWD